MSNLIGKLLSVGLSLSTRRRPSHLVGVCPRGHPTHNSCVALTHAIPCQWGATTPLWLPRLSSRCVGAPCACGGTNASPHLWAHRPQAHSPCTTFLLVVQLHYCTRQNSLKTMISVSYFSCTLAIVFKTNSSSFVSQHVLQGIKMVGA